MIGLILVLSIIFYFMTKVLAQPITSSSAKRNWSTYSYIHNIKRKRLNSTRADKLVFIHSNIRLQYRFSESYRDGPFKKWDINPEHTSIDDSIVRLEDLRWKSLEDDYPDITNDATKENEEEPSMPVSGVARSPHPSSNRPPIRRSGVHQTQITSFARGGNSSKDKGKTIAK